MKPGSPRYKFGPFEFEPSQQALWNAGNRVSLPAALYKLLLLLVSRPGQLVSREEIASTLWENHGTVDVENGINGAVRRLRAQLSSGAGPGDLYIETIVGTGYRFKALVEEVLAQPAGVIVPPQKANATEPVSPTGDSSESGPFGVSLLTNSFQRFAVIATVVVLALVGLTYAGFRAAARPAAAAAQAEAPSLLIDWKPVTYLDLQDELTAQAMSPGGHWIASSDRNGVAVQPVHTHDARRLNAPEGLRVDHLAWFPDEQNLLVSGLRAGGGNFADRSETWVVSMTTEPPKLLLEDAAMAAVSPDGRRVAYARAGRSELWIADADGQRTYRLLNGKLGETYNCLLWSPKSDRIVVDRGEQIPAETDVEKAAVDQLQHQMRWTYESYDATSGKLLASQKDLHFDSGYLLADGRFLYPVVTDGEVLRLGAVRTDPASGVILERTGLLTPAGLGFDVAHLRDLSASRSGKELSAIVERPRADVYLGDVSHTAKKDVPLLTNINRLVSHSGTTYPTAWSPQSDTLIFDEGDAGRWVIASQSLHEDKTRILADTGGRAVQGQFTPDGKWLLFLHYAGKPSSVQSIDRVPPGGGKPEQVYASNNILDYRCPHLSSATCVVRETIGSSSLVFYAFDAGRGRGAELARTPWQPNVLGDWSLSPDGSTVAMANHDVAKPGFTLIQIGSNKTGTSSTGRTTTMKLDGFGTVLCPTWAIDSKGFFVETHSATGYAIVYVDLKGHANLFLKSPDPIWAVQSLDGKKLAFPGHTPVNRNVWVGSML